MSVTLSVFLFFCSQWQPLWSKRSVLWGPVNNDPCILRKAELRSGGVGKCADVPGIDIVFFIALMFCIGLADRRHRAFADFHGLWVDLELGY